VTVEGVTAIELSVAAVTVTGIVPVINPEVAVSTAVPAPIAVATPPTPILMTAGLLEVHPAAASALVLPSEELPVAVKVTDAPRGMGGRFAGVTAMLSSTGVPILSGVGGETIVPTEAVIWVDALPTPAARAVALGVRLVPGASASDPSHTRRTM